MDAETVPGADHDTAIPLAQTARLLYAMRRRRDRMFGDLAGAFREPAWDMMLDLFMAAAEDRPVSKTSAAIASLTAQTTGLRWVDTMIRKGLLQLAPDAGDGRRSLIELTPASHAAMSDYLSEVRDTVAAGGDG
jgi:hypothetical protein